MNKHLDFFGLCMSDAETYELFLNTLFPMMEEKFSRKIYRIMLYDCYHSYDFTENKGTYRFKYNSEIYYPFTVFVGKKVEMVWVKWLESDLLEPEITPFRLKKDSKLCLCDNVPSEFEDFIRGKKLYKTLSKNVVFGSIDISGYARIDYPRMMGRYNELFVDEAARQMQERLEELIGEKLTNRWSIGFPCIYNRKLISPIKVNNENYLSVPILGPFGHAAHCGIAWEGDIKTSDCVKENDFTIRLVDIIPGTEHMTVQERDENHVWCTPLKFLKQYFLHGGWYFQWHNEDSTP